MDTLCLRLRSKWVSHLPVDSTTDIVVPLVVYNLHGEGATTRHCNRYVLSLQNLYVFGTELASIALSARPETQCVQTLVLHS